MYHQMMTSAEKYWHYIMIFLVWDMQDDIKLSITLKTSD
jgi:hypothetical protein